MVNCVNPMDRSNKISIEYLEATLASLRASTTESRAVLVECPLLKPDWLLSRRLLYVRRAEIWLNTIVRVFTMNERDTDL